MRTLSIHYARAANGVRLATLVALLVALSAFAQAQMLSFVGGRMDVTSLGETARFYEVGYRQVVIPDVSMSFDYLNEGHVTSHHRDGYGVEGWYHIPLPSRK